MGEKWLFVRGVAANPDERFLAALAKKTRVLAGGFQSP
jgi:hypothetical protein